MKNIIIRGNPGGGLYNYVETDMTLPISTYNASLCAVVAASRSLGSLYIYRPTSFLNPFTEFVAGSGYLVLAHQDFTIYQVNAPLLFPNDIWSDSIIWEDSKTFSST